ncbi:hypothetical protein [Nocardioides marmoribigeumensis]|uniref:hypothetical protein n=1 Tax=Nocardioides marmoribigeumensis TaxID=433649 RepID=UPI00286BF3F0|nr:hypothetical protein [Nocardioides marmoribigeumensis]
MTALAGVTCVRLALIHAPLSPDEAGFLRMGAQWSHGSSLYGDYWVSRPPGITAIYSLAAHLGGSITLRVIGLLAAVASVLLAVAVARTLTRGRTWPAVWAGVLTAALLSTPNLDVNVVDGEILALPFLMAGILGALRATVGDPSRRARLWWAVCAGASGAAALSIKQNLLDVGVLLGGLVLVLAARRAWRPVGDVVLGALAGAVALVVPLLLLAIQRGTSLGGLWDAVVMYRFRAAEVLGRPSHAKSERWGEMVGAFTSSGAPWVLLLLPTLLVPRRAWRALARRVRRTPERAAARPAATRGSIRPDDPALAWVATALVLFEAFSVKGGGGFWLHYLVGTVPGLTLVLALSLGRLHPRAGWWRWAPRLAIVGGVVAATCVVTVPFLQDPPQGSADEKAVATYLREHAHLGRTAVVAFGRPTILEAADMNSPYPQLWSVPVLTDDPDLTKLTPVLAQQRATWVVTRTDKLQDWGMDDTHAMKVLARNYQRVRQEGDLEVWRARSADPAMVSARARPMGRPLP